MGPHFHWGGLNIFGVVYLCPTMEKLAEWCENAQNCIFSALRSRGYKNVSGFGRPRTSARHQILNKT